MKYNFVFGLILITGGAPVSAEEMKDHDSGLKKYIEEREARDVAPTSVEEKATRDIDFGRLEKMTPHTPDLSDLFHDMTPQLMQIDDMFKRSCDRQRETYNIDACETLANIYKRGLHDGANGDRSQEKLDRTCLKNLTPRQMIAAANFIDTLESSKFKQNYPARLLVAIRSKHLCGVEEQ